MSAHPSPDPKSPNTSITHHHRAGKGVDTSTPQGPSAALLGKSKIQFLQQVEQSLIDTHFPGSDNPFFTELAQRRAGMLLDEQSISSFQRDLLRGGDIGRLIAAAESRMVHNALAPVMSAEQVAEFVEIATLCQSCHRLMGLPMVDSGQVTKQVHAGIQDVQRALREHSGDIKATLSAGDHSIDWNQVEQSVCGKLMAHYQEQCKETTGQHAGQTL